MHERQLNDVDRERARCLALAYETGCHDHRDMIFDVILRGREEVRAQARAATYDEVLRVLRIYGEEGDIMPMTADAMLAMLVQELSVKAVLPAG